MSRLPEVWRGVSPVEDQTNIPTTHPTPSFTPQVSEIPSGPLTTATTSRSFGSSFTATISPYDFQSFITDIQQPWLTQPPSPRLSTQQSSQPHNLPQQDFVLFPEHRPVRSRVERAQETSSTLLNQRFGLTQDGHQPTNHRRISTQQSHSVSPFQNPRVRNSIQGIGSSTSSQRLYPNGNPKQQHNFYASSAPVSSTALHRTRPPVPLFGSDGNLPRVSTNMAQYDSPIDMGDDLFSLSDSLKLDEHTSPDFGLFDDTVSEIDFNNPAYPIMTNSSSTNHSASTPQTVSPKDLFMDGSAPNSSALTNMSTPITPYDNSPANWALHSHDPSPNDSFLDHELDEQAFPSLFPELPAAATDFQNALPVPSIEHQAISPPAMARHQSSPGQVTARLTPNRRHSLIAGINARRRDKPLPEVTVSDPNDPTAVKRARNTEAARKSRQKKVERFDQMATHIDELEEQKRLLAVELEFWKSQAYSLGYQQ